MSAIHPTAVIEPGAEIAPTVSIGAYCVIGPHVTLRDGVVLHSHVTIAGHTLIGENTEIFPFSSLGHPPQDLKFTGEESYLEIGSNNVIREHVTMNPGTSGGGLFTRVGNNCLFMVGSHIAHDCQVGDRVIMANQATLAGHVSVGDGAIIGGLAAIHQFVRIGQYSIIGGLSGVEKDVVPYGSVLGERGHLAGLNLVGLKRRQVKREQIHSLRNAFKELFEQDQDTLHQRAASVREKYNSPEVLEILNFLGEDSSRSFCTPKTGAA